MNHILISLFNNMGFTDDYAAMASRIILTTAVILLSIAINFIVKKAGLSLLAKAVKRTIVKWDDILLEKGVFTRLVPIAPIVFLSFTLPLIFQDIEGAKALIERTLLSAFILILMSVINSFLSAVNEIYRGYEISKNRPIKSYLQIIKIFVIILSTVLVISTILNRSALGLLSGIGALSAVLMLVFKDSILGLVAAFQLSENDMVRIGDWISLPDQGADGDVIDIKLQTITIQNFDKTIVNVPIYSLISSSFVNWRGMSESGGRRIKRHISIDMNSVKFCTSDLLQKFNEVDILKDYIMKRQKEIDDYNLKEKISGNSLVNGRRMTNLGIFRAYIGAYLKKNPMIDTSMTFLIRQLQPTDKGIPLEIYVFSRDQVWANYENIQADIFDHILASISFFDLAIYQSPSSLDLRNLSIHPKPQTL